MMLEKREFALFFIRARRFRYFRACAKARKKQASAFGTVMYMKNEQSGDGDKQVVAMQVEK
jgi:hypothetical protein